MHLSMWKLLKVTQVFMDNYLWIGITYSSAPNTIKECYKINFNVNDIYNKYLCVRYFPIVRKSGWRSNYTDFLFACYQMNLYSLYHEIENFSEEKIDHKSFTIMLYEQLMIQVEKLEDGIPKKSKDDL